MNYETIKYINNYLDTVIFRIDFSEILSIKNNLAAEFQNEISDIFPRLESNFCSSYTGTISSSSLNIGHENFLIHEFSNTTKDLFLKISFNSLVLEAKKYNDFETFTDTLHKIMSSFNKIYTNYEINRIGLRFINIIKLPYSNIHQNHEYINQSLLTNFEFAHEFLKKEENCYINRNMNQLSFKFDDDNCLTFSYGIYNSEWPAPITQNEFILDYDAYTNFVDKTKNIEEAYLKPFHSIIQTAFEDSIGDSLRKKMSDDDK